MPSLSDLASVIEAIRYLARRRIENGETDRLRSMRHALKEIHFSDHTLDTLRSIRDNLDNEDYDYLAGKLAIIQRDNETLIGTQLHLLQVFEDTQHLSIRARKAVRNISSVKYGVRATICQEVLGGSWKDNPDLLANLIMQIEELNEEIEELDQQLGGIIL